LDLGSSLRQTGVSCRSPLQSMAEVCPETCWSLRSGQSFRSLSGPEFSCQAGDSGISFLQRLVSPGHYIKPSPILEKTTTTRNILPTIVASSNFLDLSSYPLLDHALLGFGWEDLDLPFHQRNLNSPLIPLRNLLLLGSLEP
jgi:hypothetical protein